MIPRHSLQDARGRFRTEGRRQLHVMFAGEKIAAIAARLHVAGSYACDLLSGKKRPGIDLAKRLSVELGIPMAAWCEPPDSNSLMANAADWHSDATDRISKSDEGATCGAA